MKLDRNIEANKGRGKYAILKLREVDAKTGTTQPIAVPAATAKPRRKK